MSHSGPVLVFVHHHIQSPVQAVFHAPVLARHFVESLWCKGRAEQVVGGFGADFLGRFPHTDHLANGLQTRPLMLLLQPFHLGRDCRRARFDPSVIGFDHRRHRALPRFRIVEQQRHVVVQALLISLQCQRVVPLLLHDLRGDCSLAVQRVGGDDGAFQS